MDSHDLVVIGTGVAASVVASRVRQAGWSVAIVDYRPFGGTCAVRGCDPKKVLVGGAETVDLLERMHRHGVSGQARIDWPSLVAFKRSFTDPVPEQRAKRFAQAGIDALRGNARFAGPDTIAVDGATLRGRHILLANGARPVPLRIPGAEHLITSDAFMELEHLPQRVVMVGGGYIAAEFANIAARAGANVTVVELGPRMLSNFDPDLVDWLMPKFTAIGIEVRTQAEVEAVERSRDAFRVHLRTNGQQLTVDADLVVHAAGRAPDIEALNPGAADVAVEEGRLQLNDYLQSVSNPRVYAAGDAAAKGPPLTPVASHDGEVVADNLLNGGRHRPNYEGIPSVVFTLPPIASVGLSEAAARERGLHVKVRKQNSADWYTARRIGEPVYGFKTLVEEGTRRILGAHIVGPDAAETINLFALAIRNDITADGLKRAIFAYPTAASDIDYML